MAEKKDVAFHLGNTWNFICDVADAAGVPIANVSQAEWRLATDTALIMKLTLGAGITSPSPGRLWIKPDPSLQSGVAAGTYSHELWILDGSTQIDSIQVLGACKINPSLRSRYP